MNKVLNFFYGLIDKLGDDFTRKNVNDEEIPCGDYMNDNIPMNRVIEDRKKCIHMMEKFLCEAKDSSEKELVLAIYANFYIKYGMAGRFEEERNKDENDGLNDIFKNLNSKDMYLQAVYRIVKTQNDDAWKEILEINKESIVAKIYIFVKLCFAYCQDAKNADEEVVDVDKYEKMWELYETIPEIWKNYLLGEGELYRESSNHAMDENLLPHMDFVSTKEILMQYIPKYYFSVLDKLGICHSIEPGFAYGELLEKLGLRSVADFFVKELPQKLERAFENRDNAVAQECMLEMLHLVVNSIQQFAIANENFDMTFLTEKIHCLQFDDDLEWGDSRDILEEYSFSEMYMGLRMIYLHLTVQGPIKKSLFLSQYNEYVKNRIVKRNIKQKKEMMDYYAHSWKHISYPQIVKEIAEELGDSNRIIANRLMKAYNSERTLQRGIQLLQYITSEDESKVSREFKNGIAKSGSNAENCISLQKVICDSLDLVVFKILMVESDDSGSIERCREKWKQKRSLEDLREEYTEMFLNGSDGNEKIIEWVNDNLMGINLKVGDEWNSVRFKDDSFALNQFKEILVEIFTNVFLHGEECMILEFSSTDDEMCIYEINECTDILSGSKSGISTLERVLEYINHGTNVKALDTKLEDKFEITIRINKKILIRKGR